MVYPSLVAAAMVLLSGSIATATAGSFEHFITRRNDTLFDGGQPFRFISFNVPNLHFLEDDFSFVKSNNWSLPTSFEIRDALISVKDAGGTVVRQYCLRIQKDDEPPFLPKHLTSWRTFYEPAFRTLDTVLALANEYGIRVIIPFLEGPRWWGPKRHFASMRKNGGGFESDSIKDDYRYLVSYVLDRRNTVNGVLYKDDMTILCWETGNEMPTSGRWLAEMAAYIKRIDNRHLLMDGNYGVRSAALRDPHIDIVTNHFYRKPARLITRDIKKIKGSKAYIIGEWGWTKERAGEVIRRTIHSPAAGALVWSLRYRYRNGGFTWHKGQGLHWPGGFARSEQKDEKAILTAVRQAAFSIRKITPPPFRIPASPVLLPIDHPSSISWQGSAGATRYTIERATVPGGTWKIVGDSIDETIVAYRPLFNDTSIVMGNEYYYQVIAHGPGGTSSPSEIAGPVSFDHYTMVDEFISGRNKCMVMKGTKFTDAQPWRFKYDFHRRKGAKGDYMEYLVNGTIIGVTMYTYFKKKPSEFTVQLSSDGVFYTPIAMQSRSIPYCCADPRDRLWLPVLFTADSLPKGCNRVRIVYPCSGPQIGRCEIDYR